MWEPRGTSCEVALPPLPFDDIADDGRAAAAASDASLPPVVASAPPFAVPAPRRPAALPRQMAHTMRAEALVAFADGRLARTRQRGGPTGTLDAASAADWGIAIAALRNAAGGVAAPSSGGGGAALPRFPRGGGDRAPGVWLDTASALLARLPPAATPAAAAVASRLPGDAAAADNDRGHAVDDVALAVELANALRAEVLAGLAALLRSFRTVEATLEQLGQLADHIDATVAAAAASAAAVAAVAATAAAQPAAADATGAAPRSRRDAANKKRARQGDAPDAPSVPAVNAAASSVARRPESSPLLSATGMPTAPAASWATGDGDDGAIADPDAVPPTDGAAAVAWHGRRCLELLRCIRVTVLAGEAAGRW